MRAVTNRLLAIEPDGTIRTQEGSPAVMQSTYRRYPFSESEASESDAEPAGAESLLLLHRLQKYAAHHDLPPEKTLLVAVDFIHTPRGRREGRAKKTLRNLFLALSDARLDLGISHMLIGASDFRPYLMNGALLTSRSFYAVEVKHARELTERACEPCAYAKREAQNKELFRSVGFQPAEDGVFVLSLTTQEATRHAG